LLTADICLKQRYVLASVEYACIVWSEVQTSSDLLNIDFDYGNQKVFVKRISS
jgi:hypothetical protein